MRNLNIDISTDKICDIFLDFTLQGWERTALCILFKEENYWTKMQEWVLHEFKSNMLFKWHFPVIINTSSTVFKLIIVTSPAFLKALYYFEKYF